MARMIDRLRGGAKFGLPIWSQGWPDTGALTCSEGARIRRFLDANPPVIVLDETADYLFTGTDQENWDWRQGAFPCIKSPFGAWWMEYRQPIRIVSEKYGVIDNAMIETVGMMCAAMTREELVEYSIIDVGRLKHAPEYLCIDVFLEPVKGEVHGPMQRWVTAMNAAGEITDQNMLVMYCNANHYSKEERETILDKAGRKSAGLLFPALLGLSFLNCKNVRRVEQAPPAPLSKKFQRHHGVPLTKYYTLQIDPMKRVLRSEGRSETEGLARAMHICRGHFATYTKDRPLFGKLVGSFWHPMHTRGSNEAGRIEKTYNVKGPRRK